jgi:cytochrome c peroxidase
MKKTKTLFIIMLIISVGALYYKNIVFENKVNLGHYLFYENKLSLNNTKSCGSCHAPQFAFTDGYRTSVTPLGDILPHNAPSLINASSLKYFDWANPTITTLTQQIKRPLYNAHPMELGFQNAYSDFMKFVNSDSLYSNLFAKAFPFNRKIQKHQIEEAISAYTMQLNSYNSRYDLGLKNNFLNFSNSEKNGMKLFNSSTLKCITCHAGKNFTLASVSMNTNDVYKNIGLYNIDYSNNYPGNDNGIYYHTKNEKDKGKFKIPSLRNTSKTAPYMHDGSVATLEEVIAIYARGGRIETTGIHIGDGKTNIYKDSLITGFQITESEIKDLINFLYTLTDSSIEKNKLFINPHLILP